MLQIGCGMGTLNVRVPSDAEGWLDAFAKGRGLTKSDIVREAIAAFQSSYENSTGTEQEDSNSMTAVQCARLSGMLEREEPIVDEMVWGEARRGFKRFCFPADFRRSQREKIRPAFDSFAMNFNRLPKRTGWHLRIGEACPGPQIVSHVLNGDVEFYSSAPIGQFEPVENLYFSWNEGIIRRENIFDPRFSIMPDAVNLKLIPTIVRNSGDIFQGHPFSLEDLSSHRIYDLLLEAFDIITKDLHDRFRPNSTNVLAS
ncbi:hypothetical protein [Sphingomonas sp. LH128]|uniref:hypothetical protein n=1 Tax=Sphingomonas sp. LH128 TaxID=473781 RepID=UPI002E0F54EF